MPDPAGPEAAATAEYNAYLAAARASGIASNAFPGRDNQGVVPLSLPPEGSFLTLEALKSSACKHAELAGYCLVWGEGGGKRADKGNRYIKFLI